MTYLPGTTPGQPSWFWRKTMKSRIIISALFLANLLLGWTPADNQSVPVEAAPAICPPAKYLIILIGDGMGNNQRLAANLYSGTTPAYQGWLQYWVSTYPAGGSYDPDQAWTYFS
jgi:alkaline phosphatase